MVLDEDVKLPKQWRHWCSKLGLRTQTWPGYKKDRSKYTWFYLKGKGHVWRVNCLGYFERGDTYEEFDRWALCNIDHVQTVPQTFAEFKNAVESLISIYDPNRPLGGY